MAQILRQTTVARDGMHNGFTDLAFWQGCYWVSYRKGAGHASMDGEAVVAMSADRRRFREVARLHVPGDNRDPKLLPLEDGRLAMYFPSWTHGHQQHDLQHYITFSENGYEWEKPRPILPPKMWLWRIRRHDGRYYGLIQNLSGEWAAGKPPHQLDLAVSDDLLDWQIITRIGPGKGLNESDIFWREDGEAWLVSRTVTRSGSFFASARAPFTDWDVVEMQPLVHAPIFLHHKGQLYVAGRNRPALEGDTTFPFPSFSLGVWKVERGELSPLLRIPAVGDCSYPGLIEDPEGRVCLSYYSQHAYTMGVLEYEGESKPSDVYFAELELD